MDLTERACEVLEVVAGGKSAWRRSEEIALELGESPTAIAGELLAMEASGLVERWPLPCGRLVFTLTPLAAELLTLDLVEVGPLETPAWHKLDANVPPIVQLPDPELKGRNPTPTLLDSFEFQFPPVYPSRRRKDRVQRHRDRKSALTV